MFNIKRKPTTIGEILKEEFLVPLGMTQKQLAEHVRCDLKVINRLVNERTSLSAEMAIKFAATFNTSPDFWLNGQKAMDLYKANQKIKYLPKPINLDPIAA